MKKVILVLWVFVNVIAAVAQTNVSGGIFANTTWTKANSPYILTDTTVVFPGYTLTIEPGVVVRFDNRMMLEIRQATIIAIGTSVDSITFTSNSLTPVPGSWNGISVSQGNMLSEFSFCNFHYATTGLSGTIDSLRNSVFSNNQTGLSVTTHSLRNSVFLNNQEGCGIGSFFGSDLVEVDSCHFINNSSTGMYFSYGIVSNSEFINNGTGLKNGSSSSNKFFKCTFKNNYAGMRNYDYMGSHSTTKVDSCVISNNTVGITDWGWGGGYERNLHIKNSLIDSNSRAGIYLSGGDSVINCQITHNGIGVSDTFYNSSIIRQNKIESNSIGIKCHRNTSKISCNKICNNASYDFYWASSTAFNVSGNYWCTTDSTAIAAKIYDAYDNPNSGIVTFMPLDTSQCYLAGATVSVSGAILTETGTLAPGVTVTLSGDDVQTTTTGTNGNYNFTVPQGGSYTVTPSKNNDVVTNNGITSIDILLTRRHILGTPFSTPYKIIASDVDASNSVSTLDILLMRSMILQNIATFPNGRLWSFVPDDYVFADVLNPFPFPTSRTYTNITTNQTNQNFIGIKLGDVNGSWDAGVP